MVSSSHTIGRDIARADDDTDRFNTRSEDLLNDDGKCGLGDAITVDERLEWKRALILPGGGDEGLADIHANLPSVAKHVPAVNWRDELCSASSTRYRHFHEPAPARRIPRLPSLP